MCLVVLAIGQHPEYPIILAGNRDEFHARPTADAHWWSDNPQILGGRDLEAGGTWLALHQNGRFATVTNYRDTAVVPQNARSRGYLVTEYLESDLPPLDYLTLLDGSRYAGFNLIVGDRGGAAYTSNRAFEAQQLATGIYGLSNALLDEAGDKVRRSKRRLEVMLQQREVDADDLLHLLDDRVKAPREPIKAGEPDGAIAHALTAPFVVMPDYGTRCSTVVLADNRARWQLTERRFDASGEARGDSTFRFADGS